MPLFALSRHAPASSSRMVVSGLSLLLFFGAYSGHAGTRSGRSSSISQRAKDAALQLRSYLHRAASTTRLKLNARSGSREGVGISIDKNLHSLSSIFFYDDMEGDRKSTRLNSSHNVPSRMPSSA